MADTDFSFIGTALDPSSRIVDYTVKEIPWDPPVVLKVRHAGPENVRYWNEGMEWRVANATGLDDVAPPKTLSPQERLRWFNEATNREQEISRRCDRYLYPRLIISGWSGVVDSAGKEVAFSVEECEAFLRAIPPHVLQNLCKFCQTIANFYGDRTKPTDRSKPAITPADAEALAGNS